jgi:hypothetical protein
MKERRALVEGLALDSSQKDREKAFVYGDASKSELQPPAATHDNEPPVAELVAGDGKIAVQYDSKVLPQFAGRVPVTTRARPEVATALKRASLTRQLNGIEPFYVQDIMEVALETWLRDNGYI